MYIVDKNKDYYDHISHIYGVDKSIVFDRRGSQLITNEDLFNLTLFQYHYNFKEEFLLLEIGNIQCILKIYDVKMRKNLDTFKSFKINIMYTYMEQKHIFDKAISIRLVDLKRKWERRWRKNAKYKYIIPSLEELVRTVKKDGKSIDLPILRETSITKLIDGETIWRELSNYISSLDNDKDISIPMADKEKAGTHGFDKYSFRHPIK